MAEHEQQGSTTKTYRIGYALAPKKQQSFIQQSLITVAKTKGIDLLRIDIDRPLIDQGPFDCILHKLYGVDWKSQLSQFKVQNPHAVIIDAPENIEILHNRISMLQVVSELEDGENIGVTAKTVASTSFGIPNQIVIYNKETLFDERGLEMLRFPVIAKPLVADGSAKSHKMVLVFNQGGLGKLKPPIVLQEFVNHGGVIFKVYVVGEYVKCVKRKSLPDVSKDRLKSFEDCLPFSQVSNLGSKERNDDSYVRMMHLEDVEMPPDNFLRDIAKGLRNALGLNLFNFDVIRDTKIGNRYLVIDINYFPGYAKMPGYENVLTDFFCDVLCKGREMTGSGSVGEGIGKVEKLGNDTCSSVGEGIDEVEKPDVDEGIGEEDKLGVDTQSVVSKMMISTCGNDGEDSGVPVSPLARDEKENMMQV